MQRLFLSFLDGSISLVEGCVVLVDKKVGGIERRELVGVFGLSIGNPARLHDQNSLRKTKSCRRWRKWLRFHFLHKRSISLVEGRFVPVDDQHSRWKLLEISRLVPLGFYGISKLVNYRNDQRRAYNGRGRCSLVRLPSSIVHEEEPSDNDLTFIFRRNSPICWIY